MPEKIAVITGTSSGFGLLTSIELAKAGFRVVATLRNLARREPLDRAAAAAGCSEKIEVQVLDVTDFGAIPPFVDAVVRNYGRVDVLVNNAGFAVGGFAEDVKLEELRLQFETNFFGAVAMSKAVLPVMRRQGSGHIIQISSIAGLQGSVSVSSYSASKHALEGWSESLRLEVHSVGIRVALVEPGAFDTGVWTSAVMGQETKKNTSPNFQRSLRMRQVITSIPKADPITVARVIVAVAQNPNPKLRHLVCRLVLEKIKLTLTLPSKCNQNLILNYHKLSSECRLRGSIYRDQP